MSNAELYDESLEAAKEQEKIAEEEAIEAARIAREKEEEEERQKIREWAEENKKILEKKTIPLELVKFTNQPSECYDSEYLSQTYPLIICFKKNNFTGFDVMWEVIFKNGYRHVTSSMTLISYYEAVYDFHLDEKTLIELESSSNDLEQHVEEVNIYVTGIDKKYSENNNLLASEIYSLSSMPLDVLKYNYYETLGIKYKIYPTDR